MHDTGSVSTSSHQHDFAAVDSRLFHSGNVCPTNKLLPNFFAALFGKESLGDWIRLNEGEIPSAHSKQGCWVIGEILQDQSDFRG